MEAIGQVAHATLAAIPSLCTSVLLPSNGVVDFGNGLGAVTLTAPAMLTMPCPTLLPRNDLAALSSTPGDSSLSGHGNSGPQVSDFRDPFYASTFPICFALAATTVTSYMLVIMLFITPRSFLDGGIVRLSRHSFTNSASGGVSIGGRPWLQKVAALTVAASLTLATASTFHIAQVQYSWGAQNANVLQDDVMGGTELKVIRLISDTFLWLAQAQTLTRLFPRQREKIIIKWAAFALVTLDLIFSGINSFKYTDNGVNNYGRPPSFLKPIPALSYLFQSALGLLYAAWVIYYALMKKRYAFYHPLMKNICLVATISLVSILIPIVFFILDISKPEFTAWGDYVRWVGAAAASVVVWEWVERIEALEREEKKDGILGREVFDGDDMLEVNASDFPALRNRKYRKTEAGPEWHDDRYDHHEHGRDTTATGRRWSGAVTNNSRHHDSTSHGDRPGDTAHLRSIGHILRPQSIWPSRPPPVATPVSRTDSPSATSTVYTVRYQHTSEATSRTPDPQQQPQGTLDLLRQDNTSPSRGTGLSRAEEEVPSLSQGNGAVTQAGSVAAASPRRPLDLEANRGAVISPARRTSPPSPTTDVGTVNTSRTGAISERNHRVLGNQSGDENGRWNLKAKFEDFAANQADKVRERFRPTADTGNLPVTVIPAPARRGAVLQQVLEEEESNNVAQSSPGDAAPPTSNGSPLRDVLGESLQAREGPERSQRGGTSAAPGRNQERSLPPNNPPLWPGVRSQARFNYGDENETEEYAYDDGSSVSETSSELAGAGNRPSLDGGSRPP